jgi:hypothetical protein
LVIFKTMIIGLLEGSSKNKFAQACAKIKYTTLPKPSIFVIFKTIIIGLLERLSKNKFAQACANNKIKTPPEKHKLWVVFSSARVQNSALSARN